MSYLSQGGKDEGEFNLLFHSIKTKNQDAFEIVLPKSKVGWTNSIGMFSLVIFATKKSEECCTNILTKTFA